MNEFVTFILQTIFYILLFHFFAKILIGAMEVKRQEKLRQLNELDQITHRVNVEQHGAIYYWFDADDGEFLGQGKDIDSIIQVVKSRFPTHVFFLNNDKNEILKLHGPTWKFDRLDLKISN